MEAHSVLVGFTPDSCRAGAAANRRDGPEAELRTPWERWYPGVQFVTPAVRPAVRPPAGSRSRPRDGDSADDAKSRCSSDAIPADAGSPSGLPPFVRNGPAHCLATRMSRRCADFVGLPCAAMTPLPAPAVET